VCDYGGVLSLPQSPDDLVSLSRLAGLGLAEFEQRYWAERTAYDRGDLDVGDYWAKVVGDPLEQDRLEAVIAADVDSWLHLNADSTAGALRAQSRGWRLALLSNAPFEVARAIDRIPELATFDPRWFSCDLGVVKPEPEIYNRVLAGLGAQPSEVVFVDDRSDNVATASSLGITAVLFSSATQFDALPFDTLT
jgi:putative hydrolase of the HAD superfamily